MMYLAPEGSRLGGNGLRDGRDFPFVLTLQAAPVIAARLRVLGFRADVAAFRTGLRHRLVPHDEIALGIIGAPIERLSALLGPAHRDLAAVARTVHSRRHGSRSTTSRDLA